MFPSWNRTTAGCFDVWAAAHLFLGDDFLRMGRWSHEFLQKWFLFSFGTHLKHFSLISVLV